MQMRRGRPFADVNATRRPRKAKASGAIFLLHLFVGRRPPGRPTAWLNTPVGRRPMADPSFDSKSGSVARARTPADRRTRTSALHKKAARLRGAARLRKPC